MKTNLNNILKAIFCLYILLIAVNFLDAGEVVPLDVEKKSYAEREAELTNIKSELQVKYMKMWIDATRGENIALGKKISASMAPNYKSAPNNKLENLLDGKLSKREDGKILFSPEAFAWVGSVKDVNRGIYLIVDLQQDYPIKTIAMRCMGGGATSSQQVPSKITVLTSEDGLEYYEAGTFLKVGKDESSTANNKNLFYLEETGENFVFPICFPDLKIKARYVVFLISGTITFFADEIAIIKGDFAPEQVKLNPEEKRIFIKTGLVFYPAKGILAVSRNIITPNFIYFNDFRKEVDMKKEIKYCLELPNYLEVMQTSCSGRISVQPLDANNKKWILDKPVYNPGLTSTIGPLYFKVTGKPNDTKDCAYFYAECEGYKPNKVEVPLQIIDIPKVPELKKFHVSLAWMTDKQRADWPSFLEAYGHMGFNTVPTFPHYYMDKSPVADKLKKDERLAALQEARAHGFKILQVESPFHIIYWRHKNDDEIFCQLPNTQTPGRTSRVALCPSYRGPFYREEIERVGEAAAAVQPDYIFYDIECWGTGFTPKCEICQNYKAKLKIDDERAFLQTLGKEHINDLYTEIKKRLGKVPLNGTYAFTTQDLSHSIYSFKKLYPQLLNFTQPSLYVGGNVQKVHSMLSTEFNAIGKRICIPWLSTGTGGEYDSRKIEPMLYTAFLDGVAGITYFQFFDFDTPLDFYYHAKALATLAPFEDILASGKIMSVACDNPSLMTCAWENREKKAILLLVYNHISDRTENAAWTMPVKNLAEVKNVRDILSGKNLQPNMQMSVRLGPGEFIFYLVEKIAAG